jgi:peptidoglycan hydrolase-like protein with peptidoglycan-binding domain
MMQSTGPRASTSDNRRLRSLALVVLLFLCITGAVSQTPKTASKTRSEASAASAGKKTTASPKKTTTSVKKTTTSAKKTATSAKKTATSAKNAARSRKRVVARKRGQTQPTSDRYTEIQQALIARGHSEGPATGVWGAGWVTALKGFQADQKLEATGKIDSLSLIRLGLGPRREEPTQAAGLEASEPPPP